MILTPAGNSTRFETRTLKGVTTFGRTTLWPRRFGLLLLLPLLAISVDSAFAEAEGKPLTKNHLVNESSPYLQQHVDNPVDWYPWGDEALEKAARENKPIFLSIGYSSCYWCHVMERKVFSDPDIAAYMNEHFVCIKVDREERPDLDDVYMLSLQVYLQLAGSPAGGGWPLSLFLTPDGNPIGGGTYFPPTDSVGRPGFPTVLRKIHGYWETQETEIRATGELIAQEVARLADSTSGPQQSVPDETLVDQSLAAVTDAFDPLEGGFDFNPEAPSSPKFPNPARLQLVQAQIEGESPASKELARQLDLTLDRMAQGGIHDHLGGGFHRYSTDRHWHVPHFEKMLYDNTQLLEVYLDAYRRSGRTSYLEVCNDIIEFLQRDMLDSEGGFYSALDAETDGVEGAYYLWSREELEAALDPIEFRTFVAAFGLNVEVPGPHGHVLDLSQPLADVASDLAMPVSELKSRLAESRTKLLAIRSQRTPLRKDDKILTSWNGLAIRAFAQAGQRLQKPELTETATRCAIYLLSHHRSTEGRLLHSSRNGKAHHPAYLDDYAFLTSGLLALFEATGEDKWLSAAKRLTDEQIELFADQDHGGFYFTGTDQPLVLARLKNAYDSVLPSGNSVSVQNLLRLTQLTGESSYRALAEQTLAVFAGQVRQAPGNASNYALALQEYCEWRKTAPQTQVAETLFAAAQIPRRPAVRPEENTATKNPLHVALKPDKEEAAKHDKVQVNGYLSVDRLPVGGECRIAIQLEVAEGWHLNANPPVPEYVKPVEISLPGEQPVQLEDLHYPTGKLFQVEGFDEPSMVYEGKVYAVGTLKIPADLTRLEELTVVIKYQACNNSTCLAPAQIKMVGKIPVARRGEKVSADNAQLFKALEESQTAQKKD